MKHFLEFAVWAAVVGGVAWGWAEEPAAVGKQNVQAKKPLKALLVTGGCCHDYARQKLILSKGISARADVEWTIVHQGGTATNSKIPLYEDENWAAGFDVVVHNECFSDAKEKEWSERILKPHREGLPAVLIHCAMHCYRTGDDQWFEFVGLQSPGHGPHYAFTVENLKTDHPIMAGFGPTWTTPKGELYYSIRMFPDAVPLGHARRQGDGQPQVCIWTNQYGKGRVFATTIGHYNEEMVEPKYLDLVTRGLLWATNRLDEKDSFRPTDEKTDAAIRAIMTAPVESGATSSAATACCGQGNLAFAKPTTASSEETGKNNFSRCANDGDLRTRWCANGAKTGETWQVALGKPEHVKSVRIHWEGNAAYRYQVDASADGQTWKTIVDQGKNEKVQRVAPHEVDSPDTRHLRVKFLGSSTGSWGSFWEFEAYPGKLPELPPGIETGAAGGAPAGIGDVQVIGAATIPGPDGQSQPVTREFEVTLFGSPPQVNYPVCLSAAPTGELFVGVDEQGSLGKTPGGGRVLRCLDTDGDGVADKINVFAQMDHPRGLIYDNGSLWVLHPPLLSVWHDDNRDGTADRRETLLTGISTDEVAKRGADHTTNGIRMGIDGWIYIAVGDFGFKDATGTDGRKLSRRGGGIVRVRPDGSDLEVFAWNLRNICDMGVDPFLNVFTRDNTNDGGGWNIRLSHVMQSADYGYPSRYVNFADEIMPPLADYGGGSGCGGMYFHDGRWPAPFNNAMYSCDWGRSEVYRHNLPADGPTFSAHQEVFLKIPRPTDIDADGSGLMYVSSWKNGEFSYRGPDVGFVAQIRPKNFLPKPFPELSAATDQQLVRLLASPSAVHRLHSQRELLRRARSPASPRPDKSALAEIEQLAADAAAPLYGRVAAIFTLKQAAGAESHAALLKLTADAAVREFALRALTDRTGELKDVPLEPFVAALADKNPRVRSQAVISLGRLGRGEAAAAILSLTARPNAAAPVKHDQPDPARVIPHLAVQSLISLNAIDACLAALDGPHADGALQALRAMHDERAVEGLIRRLGTTRDQTAREKILATLIRLYHHEGKAEADYDGSWWGTRPDTNGPYFNRQTWSASPRIESVVKTALAEADKPAAEFLFTQLARHQVKLPGLPDNPAALPTVPTEPEVAVKLPPVDPNNPDQIANLAFEAAAARAASGGDPQRGELLFKSQQCNACHTFADGQTPKGPHLVDIGKRYKRAELIESVLKPSAKIAQGFDTHAFVTTGGRVLTGFVVRESSDAVQLRQADGLGKTLRLDEIEERVKQPQSMMPEKLVNNLTPEQLADLLAYLESLK